MTAELDRARSHRLTTIVTQLFLRYYPIVHRASASPRSEKIPATKVPQAESFLSQDVPCDNRKHDEDDSEPQRQCHAGTPAVHRGRKVCNVAKSHLFGDKLDLQRVGLPRFARTR